EILQAHGPAAVRNVIVGQHAKLPVLEIFPELHNSLFLYLANDDPFQATFRIPCQHTRPIGVRPSRSLRDRIVDVAYRHVDAATKQPLAQLSANNLVVWVNLRAHNKAWIRQVDGHVVALRSLANDVRNLKVVLDGFVDTREFAEEIRRGLEPDIETFDTI